MKQPKVIEMLKTLRFRAAVLTTLSLALYGATDLAAAAEVRLYQWEAEEMFRGGRPIGCSIYVDGMIGANIYVTMNLSFLAEPVGPDQVENMTLLKITATEINLAKGFKGEPIKLYGGWVKVGSAATIGKLKTVTPDPEKYYLGGAPGIDLFLEVFKGLLNTGPTIGFQRTPSGIDTILTIPAPLPPPTISKVRHCVSGVGQAISDQSGTPSDTK